MARPQPQCDRRGLTPLPPVEDDDPASLGTLPLEWRSFGPRPFLPSWRVQPGASSLARVPKRRPLFGGAALLWRPG